MDIARKIKERDPIKLRDLNTRYYRQLYNLLTVIPMLLVASALIFAVTLAVG